METTIFWSDTHVPHYDRRAVKALLNFVKDIKPKRIVIMGDFLDFMSVSRWDKDPRETVTLQEEIVEAEYLLSLIREASKSSEIIYIGGNHEERLTKFLITKADSLIYLKKDEEDILSVPHLLGLREKGIEYIPYHSHYQLHGWLFEHGNIARQHSAYTAKGMVDRRGINVGMAHTHRAGTYYTTSFNKTLQGVEFGCLIDIKGPAARYSKYPNWQNAFGIGQFEDGVFQVQPILMQNYKFIWNNKVYRG